MKFIIALAAIVAVAVATPLRSTLDLSELDAIMAAIHSPSSDPATAALLEQHLADLLAEMSPISVGPAFVDFPAVEDAPTLTPAPVQPSPVVVGEVPAGSSPLVQIIVNVNAAESSAPAPSPAPVVIPDAVVAPAVVEEHQPGPVNIVEDVDVIAPAPVIIDEVYVPGPVNIVDGADIDVIAPAPVIVDEVHVPGPVNIVDGADIDMVAPAPVIVDEVYVPGPVNIVDGADIDVVAPAPVIVDEIHVPGPVNIVDGADIVPIAPIQVGTPVLPEPVIVGAPIIPAPIIAAPVVVLPAELN